MLTINKTQDTVMTWSQTAPDTFFQKFFMLVHAFLYWSCRKVKPAQKF